MDEIVVNGLMEGRKEERPERRWMARQAGVGMYVCTHAHTYAPLKNKIKNITPPHPHLLKLLVLIAIQGQRPRQRHQAPSTCCCCCCCCVVSFTSSSVPSAQLSVLTPPPPIQIAAAGEREAVPAAAGDGDDPDPLEASICVCKMCCVLWCHALEVVEAHAFLDCIRDAPGSISPTASSVSTCRVCVCLFICVL